MKIRNGFVSNSSTTSFSCAVCGDTREGWDISVYDADWWECVNEHVICDECVLSEPEWPDNDNGDFRYRMPEKYCPVCQFIEIDDRELSKYLEKEYCIHRDAVFATVKAENKRRKKLYDSEYNMYVLTFYHLTEPDILNVIKERFSSYKEYQKYIYGS